MANEPAKAQGTPSLGAAVEGLTEGRRIFGDRFTLIKSVGRGPNSVVWLAWEEDAKRDVALKFLPEIIRNDPTALAVLQREVKKLQEFKHPILVPIYDVLTEGNIVAIASEFVEGSSLAALRAERKSQVFSPAELAEWYRALLTFLEHSHGVSNLVHGSLTPNNLLVNAKGELRLTDFDLARHVVDFSARVTGQSAARSPIYFSPQQASGEPANYLDDIYTLGATTYELLTSKPPFYTGDIGLQVNQKIPPPMTHRRKELRVIGDPVPRVWEEAIAASLSKNPSARPQGAGAFMQMIGVTPLQSSAPEIVAPATPAPAPAKPNHALTVGVAIAAIVLLGLLGLMLGKRGSSGGKTTVVSRLSPEEEAKRKAETEKAIAKVKAEAEAKAMAEAERIRQDAEKKRKLAEDQSKKALDQARALEEQIRKARADEATRLAEEKRKADEAEKKRKDAEAELKRLAEEAKRAAELAGTAKSAEAEKARKEAEEKAKLAEMEAAKLKAQIEEANRLAAKRAEDEKKKADEAEKKRALAEKEAARLAAEVARARDAAAKETQRMADLRLKQIQQEVEAKEKAAKEAAAAAKAKQDEEARKLALATETKRKEDEARRKIEAEAAKFQPGKPWQNSLGLKFVPVGAVSFSVWETRVDDFEQFINATRYDAGSGWRDPGFKQASSSHPVLNVSWNDAQTFCKWLTEKERKAGIISASVSYRLPTDVEWSLAARLEGESGATPVERDLRVKAQYPWGTAWPPPAGAGNYADNVSYDGFENTAPVGSFRPNPLGIYDLGGNVWEWCDDWSDSSRRDRILRGGSYAGYVAGSLFSSYRRTAAPTDRNSDAGFRVIIEGR